MIGKKVVVAGATGLLGNAALRHFGGVEGCEVIALSRRKPREKRRGMNAARPASGADVQDSHAVRCPAVGWRPGGMPAWGAPGR